jgi:single-stranded DNA-binding protein
VTAFGQTCDFIGKYVQKGTRVCLRGSMQCDKVPSNGETKYFWNLNCDELEILSGGVDSGQKGPTTRAPYGGENYSTGNYEGSQDDLPF